MAHVLIVEDSHMVMKVIRHLARDTLEFNTLYATDFSQAKALYEQYSESIFATLVDLNLPDAPNGEIVDYMLDKRLPTVVLTGTFDEDRRLQLINKGVVDYVIKESRYSYRYAIKCINQLKRNEDIKVLVAEDSKATNTAICKLLKQLRFQVIQAFDGQEAIDLLEQQPDIHMIITDYNMPNVDGFELTKYVRAQSDKRRLEGVDKVIIGLSAEGQGTLSARFIKMGANDFLYKPFTQEEFFCRVQHNIESVMMLQKIQRLAYEDYVTGINNRRYFFEEGEVRYKEAMAKNTPVAIAVFNIDQFADINSEYGQVFGDYVLTTLAQVTDGLLSRFLVARIGANEFAAMITGLDSEKASAFVEKVRRLINQEPFDVGTDDDMFVTVRAGLTLAPHEKLNDALITANGYMDRAKSAGGDMLISDE